MNIYNLLDLCHDQYNLGIYSSSLVICSFVAGLHIIKDNLNNSIAF